MDKSNHCNIQNYSEELFMTQYRIGVPNKELSGKARGRCSYAETRVTF